MATASREWIVIRCDLPAYAPAITNTRSGAIATVPLAAALQPIRVARRHNMGLRGKYAYAIQTAKDLRMQGSADEREGKLYFKGTVNTQAEANKIWDAIKTIPEWPQEIVADITATSTAPDVSSAATTELTYVVKAGDTLSKIAKEHLGNASEYMTIFNANKDQLSDPDKIKPGQVLKIPQVAKH